MTAPATTPSLPLIAIGGSAGVVHVHRSPRESHCRVRERVALTQRMAGRATCSGRVSSAAILAQRISVLEKHATTLEELLGRSSHRAQHAEAER